MSPNIYDKTDDSGPEINSKAKTEIGLLKNQIIMIEDKRIKITFDYDAEIKYTGRYLRKNNKKNILKIGIFTEKKQKLKYKENDIVSILFIDKKYLFNFDARIHGIREAKESDEFEIDDMTFEFSSLKEYSGYSKYIFDIIPLTVPHKQQRREFFRIPLSVNIYYKITGIDETDKIEPGELKFDAEKAKKIKKIADEGILEKEMGYSKLTTIDFGAGGFRYRVIANNTDINIKEGILLYCLLIINEEALPALAQILRMTPDRQNQDLYDVRVLFDKISDPVRDRIMRYIFAKERQKYSGFGKTPENTI
ncbi:MAG: hypothetical protein FWF92_06005 [Oscillospiraceae bacterium]|nr:hypothetical protein [Oscillospiraceae bacterium]